MLHPAFDTYQDEIEGPRRTEEYLKQFERCGYRLFPLATRSLSLLCSVQILFLRPEVPGNVMHSGDIDNRLKTIFDSLRLPSSKDELGGYNAPAEDETPFFCLLEDDSMISHASVETDTLLEPIGVEPNSNDVRLTITVHLRPYAVKWSNVGFG